MGMDVYGIKPKSEEGKYFRASIWTWHPLWRFCRDIAPLTTSPVKFGHTNDGDGLNDANSIRLAQRIRTELETGRAARRISHFEGLRLEAIEDFADFLESCGGFRIY